MRSTGVLRFYANDMQIKGFECLKSVRNLPLRNPKSTVLIAFPGWLQGVVSSNQQWPPVGHIAGSDGDLKPALSVHVGPGTQ